MAELMSILRKSRTFNPPIDAATWLDPLRTTRAEFTDRPFFCAEFTKTPVDESSLYFPGEANDASDAKR